MNSSNQTCEECHKSCLTCSDSTSCSTCPENKSVLANNFCPDECERNQYFDTLAIACKDCHTSCSTCNGLAPTNCITCASGLNIKFDGTNKTCVNCLVNNK